MRVWSVFATRPPELAEALALRRDHHAGLAGATACGLRGSATGEAARLKPGDAACRYEIGLRTVQASAHPLPERIGIAAIGAQGH